MLSNIFDSVLTNGVITGSGFAMCTICSLICGLFIAALYMIRRRYSQSFILSLVLLPVIVEIVIMLVNGNLGAGVAVAGAFSLVRFRSAPGRGQEITSIFLAMAVGLATGMGYIGIAVIFTLIVAGAGLILHLTNFGGKENETRVLKITVPEDLDYEGRFDDTFKDYLERYELAEVKTTNMGTLFKLEYEIVMQKGKSIKSFMDNLRTKNGNLEISISRNLTKQEEL